jgi:hypothetical protein
MINFNYARVKKNSRLYSHETSKNNTPSTRLLFNPSNEAFVLLRGEVSVSFFGLRFGLSGGPLSELTFFVSPVFRAML